MSEPAAKGATTSGRHEMQAYTTWAGVAAFVAAIAVALGWRANWIPAPLMEVLSYVSSSFLLDGALTALEIAALAMIGGILLGLLLALMRLSSVAPIRGTAWLGCGRRLPEGHAAACHTQCGLAPGRRQSCSSDGASGGERSPR